jgi:hypothetical protein
MTGRCIPCPRVVWGGVMKCVACGAEMRLMQVQTDTVTVCGIERHLFGCSACPQSAQRLMFNRARMSSINLPVAATHSEAPPIELDAARVAGASGWTRAIEKLSSRQTALKEHKAAERTSDRLSALKAPKRGLIALRERPAAAKSSANKSSANNSSANNSSANNSSAWTNAVEKLRSRQIVLERAATARTTDTAGAFNRMRDSLRRDTSRGARLALPPAPLVRSKPQEF